MGVLDKEVATYNANLSSLLEQQGKFVLIKGDEIVGTFDTYGDALKQGYAQFGLDVFLVKRIMLAEHALFISRPIVPCPP
ncbi:MAG: hypothetical protein LBJ76_00815 [Candidatus Accumulibacter sp.]|jgi:hypothetical protein|nr:hypothetical protein [Accumulibacter sp.]